MLPDPQCDASLRLAASVSVGHLPPLMPSSSDLSSSGNESPVLGALFLFPPCSISAPQGHQGTLQGQMGHNEPLTDSSPFSRRAQNYCSKIMEFIRLIVLQIYFQYSPYKFYPNLFKILFTKNQTIFPAVISSCHL